MTLIIIIAILICLFLFCSLSLSLSLARSQGLLYARAAGRGNHSAASIDYGDLTCMRWTGGKCGGWGSDADCDADRGPTSCEDEKCICKSGYCSAWRVRYPLSASLCGRPQPSGNFHYSDEILIASGRLDWWGRGKHQIGFPFLDMEDM